MTIKMPDQAVGDKLLKIFGKKRGVIIPQDPYKKYGPYAYSKAVKENFWKTLFRSKNAPLPDNVIDFDSFKKETDENDG